MTRPSRPPAASVARAVGTAPGGIGNLGPGLDALGCATVGPRDEVACEWSDAPGVTLLDAGHPDLPTDPARHTASLAVAAVLREAARRGHRMPVQGVAVRARKRLPLASGQGGSAASAVAGAVAANALLGAPLDSLALLACALVAEEAVAGRHLDNIAPSLLGGVVLVRALDPIDVVRVPTPPGLLIVLAHPSQRLSTADARRALPDAVSRAVAVHQLAQSAAIVAACFSGDLALLGRAMDDRIAEPARAPLLPGFAEARQAALDAGSLGASISGSGPTAFALCDDAGRARRVAEAMRDAYARCGVASDVRVTTVDDAGATAEVS